MFKQCRCINRSRSGQPNKYLITSFTMRSGNWWVLAIGHSNSLWERVDVKWWIWIIWCWWMNRDSNKIILGSALFNSGRYCTGKNKCPGTLACVSKIGSERCRLYLPTSPQLYYKNGSLKALLVYCPNDKRKAENWNRYLIKTR